MQADSRSNSRRLYRSAGYAVAVWETRLETFGAEADSTEPTQPEEVQARITCQLAGILSEARFAGRLDYESAADDFAAALDMALALHCRGTIAEVSGLVKYCFASAQRIVDRPEHWAAICALVDSLSPLEIPAPSEALPIILEAVTTHLECGFRRVGGGGASIPGG